MTPTYFHALLHELVEENPFAIRPFLRLVEVQFTEEVETLAVTREAAPRLLVNLDFVRRHCTGDAQVKAVILHEFLHVLLRHTEGRGPLGAAEHLAMDAVINAIIHRQQGPGYSGMMSAYYRDAEGLLRLLRPPEPGEGLPDPAQRRSFQAAWEGLYKGRLVVDDIRELAQDFEKGGALLTLPTGALLGNHEADAHAPLSRALEEALEQSMRSMNGGGVWRDPRRHDALAEAYATQVAGADGPLREWEATATRVLRRHLLPDARSRLSLPSPIESLVPVLSPQDRRAFLRALWSPVLPDSRWVGTQPRPLGTAQIYLDVSGSMNAEMPLLIKLLNRLRGHIRMPFWAFSTIVAPARIQHGRLLSDTTGGTSMACVLKHLAATRPARAVVVTDGFIESVPGELVKAAAGTQLHALLTRDGSAVELLKARIPYTQLPKVPR